MSMKNANGGRPSGPCHFGCLCPEVSTKRDLRAGTSAMGSEINNDSVIGLKMVKMGPSTLFFKLEVLGSDIDFTSCGGERVREDCKPWVEADGTFWSGSGASAMAMEVPGSILSPSLGRIVGLLSRWVGASSICDFVDRPKTYWYSNDPIGFSLHGALRSASSPWGTCGR